MLDEKKEVGHWEGEHGKFITKQNNSYKTVAVNSYLVF